MKHISARDKVVNRRTEAFTELSKVVSSRKMKRGTRTTTFFEIGRKLEMTPQSVYNYVRGKGGDGYVIDALIEEFNKLP